MSHTRLIVAALALALAGCAGQPLARTVATGAASASADLSQGIGYAHTALSVAEAALTVYEATPDPSGAVIAEARRLDQAARAAIIQYGPEASATLAAIGTLATYLLTAAPGNGVTPSLAPSPAA